jgi:hypothetical protein
MIAFRVVGRPIDKPRTHGGDIEGMVAKHAKLPIASSNKEDATMIMTLGNLSA